MACSSGGGIRGRGRLGHSTHRARGVRVARQRAVNRRWPGNSHRVRRSSSRRGDAPHHPRPTGKSRHKAPVLRPLRSRRACHGAPSSNNDRRFEMQNTNGNVTCSPAPRSRAAAMSRRPFAPGAIGCRAMSRSRTAASSSAATRSRPTLAPSPFSNDSTPWCRSAGARKFRLLDPLPGTKRLMPFTRRSARSTPAHAPDSRRVHSDARKRARGRRDRRLRVHLAGTGGAADRAEGAPGPIDPPHWKAEHTGALAGGRAVASPRL